MNMNQEYLSALLTSLSAKFNGEVVYDNEQNALRFKHGEWNCWVDIKEWQSWPLGIIESASRCIMKQVEYEWLKQIRKE